MLKILDDDTPDYLKVATECRQFGYVEYEDRRAYCTVKDRGCLYLEKESGRCMLLDYQI